ncbi:MAG: response regulator [Anaerolineae bacterium]|nr:response regulator [Anaerolineae bacterium]
MTTLHALVVDDNAENLDVLKELLTMNGLECTTVNDPTKLVDMEMTGIDLIFLDLEMPKMNGYEALDYLRKDKGVTAPVIAYTVHSGQINTAYQRGFQGFVGKPLRPNRFPDQLKRIISGEGVWEVS